MNSITPHVASTEEIVTFPQISDGVSEVVAMPIITDFGPITPQIINNRQFLDMYTKGSGLKRSDHLSLKLAYALSQVTNLMVCRVCNTDILPGLAVGAEITKCYVKNGVVYTTEEATSELETSNIAFVIYSNSPQSSDIFNFEVKTAYTAGSSKYGKLNLNITIDGNKIFNETYDFSMNIDAEDGFGLSKFVDNINTLQNKFVILTFDNDISVPTGKASFGTVSAYSFAKCSEPDSTNSGLLSTEASKIVNDALTKMSKYRRDLKLKVLYDGCCTSVDIMKHLQKIATKRKTLGVTTPPKTANTFSKTLAWQTSISEIAELYNIKDTVSSYLYTCGPYKYDNILGWRELFPATYYYILNIYNNASGNNEFAPIYGKSNGKVAGSGLNVNFEHSTDADEIALEDDDPELPQTEALQRVSYNPMVYDESLGTCYFVNNLTLQTPNLNQLSEENNRRLFNSIQFDVNKRLDDFISRANNAITREEVAEMLDTYRIEVLDPLGYGLNKDNKDKGFRYDIKPFDSAKKNTLELTVEVCFQDSTKYINVLYRSIPVMNS